MPHCQGNYLRVRGEYSSPESRGRFGRELPPRARRILWGWGFSLWLPGTTSACAENTVWWRAFHLQKRNYLRVRGEYSMCYAADELARELPPRARRIPTDSIHHHIVRGTTSACAENTGRLLPGWMPARNYLRVRGEYSSTRAGSFLSMELPPRARRIRGRSGWT